MERDWIARIIRVYDDPIIRVYSRIRFHILRQRFLDEIGQYLPASGRVLDIGCGFGLFSLYYAHVYAHTGFHGLDVNAARIGIATRAAERLELANVSYEVADAVTCQYAGQWDAAYMLDLVHHIPPETVRPLLEQLFAILRPGARLIIKDVDTKPWYKRWFTCLLDKMMDFRTPVRYWGQDEMMALLAGVGFRTHRHAMVDYLPYPHMLYVCQRPR